MSFELCDNISPKITLYYNKHKKHISRPSAFISLFVYLCLGGLSFYFIYDFFTNSLAKAYYFIKFTNDTGIYKFDSKGLYHVVTFSNYEPSFNNSFKIIGIQDKHNLNYMADNNPLHYDHWIYEYCNKGEGVNEEENILLSQAYEKEKHVFCITKVYNKTTQKVIRKKDKEFTYPTLEHGTSNPNHVYYGLLIVKCQNNTLNSNTCNSNDIIEKNILEATKYSIYFLDNYVDLENTKDAFFSFLTKVSTVFSTETYSVNNLNFYSLEIKTHKGLLFDSIEEQTSFRFVTNEKLPYEIENSGIIGSAYFFMQNRKEVYERAYKKFQDLAASLSGVAKLIITVGELVNYLFHDYVVANDFFYELSYSKQKFNKSFHTTLWNSVKKNKINTINESQECCIDKINDKVKNDKLHVISPSSSLDIKVKKKIRKIKKFSFLEFLVYKVRRKNFPFIQSIVKYRKKIISEENMCQMFLYIKLLKKNMPTVLNYKKPQQFTLSESKEKVSDTKLLTINSVQ